MQYILRTKNLTKKYGNNVVVDNLNMNVKKGEIYGFLGENGAGKTTTIRMIMNLVKATDGEVELFGKTLTSDRYKLFNKIGTMIETPGFYTNLTAKENLNIHCLLMNINSKRRVEEILNFVGLSDTGNKKVKDFSLGMRQRLGIARALLHSPELLILDEPTNGLDPTGIKEIRELIKNLSKEQNITVLISSHILSEIEQMVDTIGIINKGKLVEEVSYKTLQEKNKKYIELTVSSTEMAMKILERELNINDYSKVDKNVMRIYEKIEQSDIITKTLILNGVDVKSSYINKENLEDHFIKMIGGNM